VDQGSSPYEIIYGVIAILPDAMDNIFVMNRVKIGKEQPWTYVNLPCGKLNAKLENSPLAEENDIFVCARNEEKLLSSS